MLWLSNSKEITNNRIMAKDKDTESNLKNNEAYYECDVTNVNNWVAKECYTTELPKNVADEGDIISNQRGCFEIISVKKGLRKGFKECLVQPYCSTHPYTRKLISNLGNEKEYLGALGLGYDLINMFDYDSYRFIMSLPHKTATDYKRVRKIVALYNKDYDRFLDILPSLLISKRETYVKSEIDKLRELEYKYRYDNNTWELYRAEPIATRNQQILSLSKKLIDNE